MFSHLLGSPTSFVSFVGSLNRFLLLPFCYCLHTDEAFSVVDCFPDRFLLQTLCEALKPFGEAQKRLSFVCNRLNTFRVRLRTPWVKLA